VTSVAQLPRIGPKGALWVLEMLRSGLSLGKRVAKLVDPNDLQTYAVIGVDADAAALEQFQGGLARDREAASSIDKLAAVLCRDFGDADLIVEDPISLPSEILTAFPTDGPPTMLACGREVYFACSLSGEIELVEQTIFSHDNSFDYNGFVVEGLPHDDADACPTELLHSGAMSVHAIVSGAYDGEGYLLAVPRQPLE
jgi:hypothetical protein